MSNAWPATRMTSTTSSADDFQSARRSPHLDAFRQRGIEVLYFSDPVDSVMVMGLNDYKGHKFRNVDEADIDLSSIGEPKEDQPVPVKEALPEDAFGTRYRHALSRCWASA
jgi:HSP90 family molecular chaperone